MSLPSRRFFQRQSQTKLYLYLAVIALSAFFTLSFVLIERERRALHAMTSSQLRLSAEQIVTELEGLVRHNAEEQGFHVTLGLAQVLPKQWTIASVRRLRNWLEQHRDSIVSDEFFVIREGAVVYPLLHAKFDVSGDRLAVAESYEFHDRRADLALNVYRQLEKTARSDSERALALWRSARCLRKLRRDQEAADAYRRLALRYADEYDPFQRPYGLLTAFELNDTKRLRELYLRFAEGAWEMPADNIEYFRQRFRERLGEIAPRETRFLRHFAAARAVQQRFRSAYPLQLGRTYACGLAEKPFVQLFYVPIDTTPGKETLLAFSVLLDTIVNTELPTARFLAGVEANAKLIEATTPTHPSEARIAFKYLFPFWQMEVSRQGGQASEYQDTVMFAGIAAVVIFTLIMGLILLIRDNRRQWKLNEMRASLVTGISHDLKTPLTAIRLYADALTDAAGVPGSEQAKYSEIIRHESERLMNSIDRVVEFSRIEKGKRYYRLEEGDLVPVVANVVEMYRAYCRPRGVSITADLPASISPVRFEEEAVSQAVQNLLDNAVKFSGEARNIHVALRAAHDSAIVSVIDSGIGIAAAKQAHIFEEFYRAEPHRGKGGAGLGLYLVRQIMDAHGGRVTVESELGCGSRFELIFPIVWPKS